MEVYRSHEPIVVALEVEYDAVATDDAASAVAPFYVSRVAPVSAQHFVKPRIYGGSASFLIDMPS
ncbi:MAG TPA: hypothetical protein VN867_16635 [Candidatus Binataceae bacterium]|nr:hypothetical protein [Candidatus Binataceae bacterium]